MVSLESPLRGALNRESFSAPTVTQSQTLADALALFAETAEAVDAELKSEPYELPLEPPSYETSVPAREISELRRIWTRERRPSQETLSVKRSEHSTAPAFYPVRRRRLSAMDVKVGVAALFFFGFAWMAGVESKSEEESDQYIQSSIADIKARRCDAALASLNKAIGVRRNYTPAYYYRGYVHNLLGHHEQAIADYSFFIDHASYRSAKALSGRAWAYLNKGELRKALADSRAWRRAAPFSPEPLCLQGVVCVRAKQYKQGARYLLEYVSERGYKILDMPGHNSAAVSKKDTEQHHSAKQGRMNSWLDDDEIGDLEGGDVSDSQDSAAAAADEEPATDQLAPNQLLQTPDDQLALEEPAHLTVAFKELGFAMRMLKQERLAAKIYGYAVSLDPGDPEALLGRARCHFALGELQDAYSECQLAIASGANATEVHRLQYAWSGN